MEHNHETKKLYRSNTDKVFAGICGGIAEYANVDATVLRLFWLLIVVFSGFFPGVLVYILAIFLVPKQPEHKKPAPTE
jgi:phage shock protein C